MRSRLRLGVTLPDVLYAGRAMHRSVTYSHVWPGTSRCESRPIRPTARFSNPVFPLVAGQVLPESESPLGDEHEQQHDVLEVLANGFHHTARNEQTPHDGCDRATDRSVFEALQPVDEPADQGAIEQPEDRCCREGARVVVRGIERTGGASGGTNRHQHDREPEHHRTCLEEAWGARLGHESCRGSAVMTIDRIITSTAS